MTKRTCAIVLAAITSVEVLASAAAAQDHDHAAPVGRLGKVHFETTCAPAARADFDRGVAQLHSFWFSAAIDSFNTALEKDPRCVMAYWGIAMSWWSNPFGGFRTPAALKADGAGGPSDLRIRGPSDPFARASTSA